MPPDLAALLSSPSSSSWDALKTCDDLVESSALDAWPDSLRVLRLPDEEALLATRFGKLAVSFEIAEDDATKVIRKLARVARSQVRLLSFHACERLSEAVGMLDAFPNLVSLDLTGEGASDEPDLAESIASELPALRELALSCQFAPIALKDADFWPSLRTLRLVIEAADTIAIGALFSDGPTLEELDLDIARSFDSAHPLDLADTIADTESLSRLRSLGTILLTPSLSRLLESCPEMSTLSLCATRACEVRSNVGVSRLAIRGSLGDEGLAAMVRAFRRLISLDAHDVGAGAHATRAIAAHPHPFERLVLSFNPIGDEGGAALAPALDGVKYLSLHHAGVGLATLRAIAPALHSVETLHLRGNRLGPEGARVIAETPMPALRQLWLGGCGIGVEGARSLAASKNLELLDFLELQLDRADSDLIPVGVDALASSVHASPAVRSWLARFRTPSYR